MIINMQAKGDPPLVLLRHLLASYVLGWFLLGGCVAIGASGAIRPQPFLKAVSRIGFYTVAAAPILYALALIVGGPHLHVLTPIGLLLPVSFPSTSTFFGVLLYVWEDFLGMMLPRLSLLFPWATAMGFGGICLIWVAACEAETRRRRLALAGGLFMVFASMSRSAIVVLVLCAVARAFLAFPRRVQLVIVPSGVAVACAVLLGSTLSSGQPLEMFSGVLDDVREVRPGATAARDRIHDETELGRCRVTPVRQGLARRSRLPRGLSTDHEGGRDDVARQPLHVSRPLVPGRRRYRGDVDSGLEHHVRARGRVGRPSPDRAEQRGLDARHSPDRHERVDLRHGGAHLLRLRLARHRPERHRRIAALPLRSVLAPSGCGRRCRCGRFPRVAETENPRSLHARSSLPATTRQGCESDSSMSSAAHRAPRQRPHRGARRARHQEGKHRMKAPTALRETAHRFLDHAGYEREQWGRVVMRRESRRLVENLGPSRLRALEISGTFWADLPFKEYDSVCYPEYDVCTAALPRSFDLIIAEQVFEHLLWPYRAAAHVYQMLTPGEKTIAPGRRSKILFLRRNHKNVAALQEPPRYLKLMRGGDCIGQIRDQSGRSTDRYLFGCPRNA